MQADEREFMNYLNALAGMTVNFTLQKEVAALFDEVGQKFGYARANIAIKQIISEKTSRDPFPSVGDLIAKIEFNHLDPEEMSVKIFGAVSKFGSYRGADARIYLGETAWKIIILEGGWEQICQMTTYENAHILQAQWRKLSAIMIRRECEKSLERVEYFGDMKTITGNVLASLIDKK